MGRGILIKWIKGIFNEPLSIIKGLYYNITNKHTDIASTRLSICKQCEHNIYYKGTKICDVCGCVLNSKTRVADEKCELNKW